MHPFSMQMIAASALAGLSAQTLNIAYDEASDLDGFATAFGIYPPTPSIYTTHQAPRRMATRRDQLTPKQLKARAATKRQRLARRITRHAL